jgi:hypothetical protein
VPADAGYWQRFGWHDGDAPARRGSGRLARIDHLGLPPPSVERDADGFGFLCAELEPARGRHIEAGDLADDGPEPAMSQAFFDADEDGLVVAGLDIDDAVGGETRLGQGRGEKVRRGDAPQDFALGPGGDRLGDRLREARKYLGLKQEESRRI